MRPNLRGIMWVFKYIYNWTKLGFQSSNLTDGELRGTVDSIPPGAVVFVSSPKTVYRGLMTHLAIASQTVGTMVDWRIRALQEHRETNYPVWARSASVGKLSDLWIVRFRLWHWNDCSLWSCAYEWGKPSLSVFSFPRLRFPHFDVEGWTSRRRWSSREIISLEIWIGLFVY